MDGAEAEVSLSQMPRRRGSQQRKEAAYPRAKDGYLRDEAEAQEVGKGDWK